MRKTWPVNRDELAALIAPHLAASGTLDEAAERLGVSRSSLEAVCSKRHVEWKPMLRAPVAAPVSYPETEERPPVPVDWTGARPQVTGGVERRLVISDTHFPFHSMRALCGVLALARAIQPHRIIHLGDVFNMGAVSLHPRPFGGRENHLSSMAIGSSFFAALHKAAPGAEIHVLAGNHDDWAEEAEDRASEFRGLFAAQRYLELDRIGATWVPRERQPLILGPVAYAHGNGGGEHFAKRYAQNDAPRAGVKHIRVGHHHRVTRYHGKNGIECVSAPWLGDPRYSAFDYAPDPGDWEVGALVDDVAAEHVTTTPVILRNGAALFAGKLIAA